MREAVIEEFPRYTIREDGVITSYIRKTPSVMRVSPNADDYLVVTLSEETPLGEENLSYTRHVHKLVAEAFLRNPHGCKVVEHIDGDKRNNHHSNLRWITRQHSALKMVLRDGHGMAKLTVKQVKQIKAVAGTHDQSSLKPKDVAFRKKLAKKYGVRVDVICAILRGPDWSYV